MSLAVDPTPATLPLPGGLAGATVSVRPLLTGEQLAPPALFDRPQGRVPPLLKVALSRRSKWFWIPIPAFLVEHPTAGPLLIDTGFHASVATDPKRNLGPFTGRLSPIRMQPEQAVVNQIAALGLEPPQILTVVMTHLHYDHASAISEFPGATFVVSRAEWESASRHGWRDGYVHRQFDHAFDWQAIDFDDPQVDSYSSFGRALDLFGDGSVRLLFTPGHSAGHMSVLLRLAQRELLVAGDAIYDLEALARDVVPLTLQDLHNYRRSVRELRLYVEQTPDAVVVPGHDPQTWPRLEPVYQ